MNFRARMASSNISPSKQRPSSKENTPSKILNKAISNILRRTPSKLLEDGGDILAAFRNDFPDFGDILNENQGDSDFEIVQTWFNQTKKIKVTEVMTQCNFPYTSNNIQMDEMWDRLHENEDTNNQVHYDPLSLNPTQKFKTIFRFRNVQNYVNG